MTRTGRHFLQIPGPTNVPDSVLQAMSRPTIDHRSREFAAITGEIIGRLKNVFRTRGAVVVFPSSGTGAAEAALVNTLSPGDRVLVFETGWFSHVAWRQTAQKLGLQVEYVAGRWGRPAEPETLERRLKADAAGEVKAVIVVHNETSTGVVSCLPELRRAIDRARHPALFVVDAISSTGCMELAHDSWGIDVTVCGSQKGLMTPPGLGFNVISEKALAAAETARLPKAYWDWQPMLLANRNGFFPYTPATNLLYGLREALRLLEEEGLSNAIERHARYGAATRAAVKAWGLRTVAEKEAESSNSVTAVYMPDGHNADDFRHVVLDQFDMSLGAGLGELAGMVFRIGHLGSFNELMLTGTLSGIEMGLKIAGVPYRAGGVAAALESLTTSHVVGALTA